MRLVIQRLDAGAQSTLDNVLMLTVNQRENEIYLSMVDPDGVVTQQIVGLKEVVLRVDQRATDAVSSGDSNQEAGDGVEGS